MQRINTINCQTATTVIICMKDKISNYFVYCKTRLHKKQFSLGPILGCSRFFREFPEKILGAECRRTADVLRHKTAVYGYVSAHALQN